MLYSSVKPIEVPCSGGMGVQGFCVVIQLRSWGQAWLEFLRPQCFSCHTMPGSFLAPSWWRPSTAPSISRPHVPFLPVRWLGERRGEAAGNTVIHFDFTRWWPGQAGWCFLKCSKEADPHAGVHVRSGGAGPCVSVVTSSRGSPLPRAADGQQAQAPAGGCTLRGGIVVNLIQDMTAQ